MNRLNEVRQFKKIAGLVKESHPANDRWYDDFEDGLRNLVRNKYISKEEYKYYMDALDHVDPIDGYGHMASAHDAAKEFVDDLRSKGSVKESGTGDEPYDFNKAAIEAVSGDKISHTEEDDEGEPIYWSTKNPNVNYYIGGDEQIIKYDGETGERYPIGDLRQYDEPTHDYEPDTDADYEEPGDDFDMAGDYNDGEFWEGKVEEGEGFDYQEDKIIMNGDTMDAILDHPELEKFITPKSFVRNKNGQIVLWTDWMDPEQFNKLASVLGIDDYDFDVAEAEVKKFQKIAGIKEDDYSGDPSQGMYDDSETGDTADMGNIN